jgi:hypothetical protein
MATYSFKFTQTKYSNKTQTKNSKQIKNNCVFRLKKEQSGQIEHMDNFEVSDIKKANQERYNTEFPIFSLLPKGPPFIGEHIYYCVPKDVWFIIFQRLIKMSNYNIFAIRLISKTFKRYIDEFNKIHKMMFKHNPKMCLPFKCCKNTCKFEYTWPKRDICNLEHYEWNPTKTYELQSNSKNEVKNELNSKISNSENSKNLKKKDKIVDISYCNVPKEMPKTFAGLPSFRKNRRQPNNRRKKKFWKNQRKQIVDWF